MTLIKHNNGIHSSGADEQIFTGQGKLERVIMHCADVGGLSVILYDDTGAGTDQKMITLALDPASGGLETMVSKTIEVGLEFNEGIKADYTGTGEALYILR